MENLEAKRKFLKEEYTPRLASLDPNAQRLWGKMDVQQMIEHMSEYVGMASGRTPIAVITPEEHLPRMQAFLMSEKPFKENTPNSLLPDEPPVYRLANTQEAIAELDKELRYLFETFDKQPDLKVANPFFGYLNFDMSVQLLHKHAWHHLRQFGITE